MRAVRLAALALALLLVGSVLPRGERPSTALLGPAVAEAQGAGSTDYLIRLLRESDAFRVRVRAADALGSRPTDPGVMPALVAALADDNAAVRAAAAASLGRVGDASVIPRLRALDGDREAAVRTAARAAITSIESRTGGGGGGGGTPPTAPSGTPRFYVGIGMPAGASVSASVRSSGRETLRGIAGGLPDVVIAPDGESASAATRELRRRSLTGFFLDSSVTVEDTPAGVRVSVQIIVQDYPGRNMRAMLSGRATVTEVHDTSSPAVAEAMAAAFTSAARGLPAAMAGSRGGGSR